MLYVDSGLITFARRYSQNTVGIVVVSSIMLDNFAINSTCVGTSFFFS